MRTVIALSLAVGAVMAQTGAVTVAPAAPMMTQAEFTAQFGAPMNPYAIRGQGMMQQQQLPYGYGARFGARAMPAQAPAPAAPMPASGAMNAPKASGAVMDQPIEFAHVDDYTNWRLAYLNQQAKKSEAVYNSPLLVEGWNWVGDKPIDSGKQKTLRDQYQLQYYKQNMQAAEYALNVAAQNDAPLAELQEIKKWYDYENLRQMNNIVGGNPVMNYQIARQDYEWDATSATEALAAASNDYERRNAQLDLQAAQIGLMDAIGPLTGSSSFGYPAQLKTMIGFMRESDNAKGSQESFDQAAETYRMNPTAANMFEMQIRELKLEKSEARYMSKLAGIVSPLAALMNGNYRLTMKYKEEQMDAKIADLQEKLAAEQYKVQQGKEPYGRTGNLASEQKTQRAFYNLLTSGNKGNGR
jgi:hypothetical protein